MKSVIFDLDGTILNSDVLKPYFDKIRSLPINSKERKELVKSLFDHTKDCCLYTGFDEIFKFIRENRINTALATSASQNRLDAVLRHFDIPIDKDRQITRYYFNRWGTIKKPNPLPLLKAMELMNSSKKNTIMIGNSSEDILAANRAQIQSVACRWGKKSEEDWEMIQSLKPTYIINDPLDLIKILER